VRAARNAAARTPETVNQSLRGSVLGLQLQLP
jgi:hypothetical protein